MNRREAIKALGSVIGAASAAKLLAACGDNTGDDEASITTFVFLMMENRSYDHYLGSRSLLEGRAGAGLEAGLANLDAAGNAVEIFPNDGSRPCLAADPPHGWSSARVQLAGGDNSGFVIAQQQKHGGAGRDPMGYMVRDQLPASYALADAYTVCDNWFSSVLGPTLPNRMYWHAGTSNGAQANQEVLDGGFRGLDSLYHRLDEVGVDWAYYYGDLPVLSFVDGVELDGRLLRFEDFTKHAARGTLAPVVYIDPAFSYNDDHPPHHPLLGQQLIATVYQALATSPLWNNCMLVVTYDENGGFYDHVAPPLVADDRAAEGFDQLGFRVPSLVVGPYVKQGFVSSVQYDHTSAIKHLENEFGLAPLTARVSAANDLVDCIDLERLAAGDPADPIQLPAVDIDLATVPNECFGDTLSNPNDHDILAWAETHPEQFGRWDLRGELPEYVEGISRYLARHGLGSIKR